MPKQKAMESVLHDWVQALPFQMQAVLLTAIRGADGTSKENHAKRISRYIRGVVLKPAGNWSGRNDNSFMWGNYDVFDEYCRSFWEDHDEYPHHFIMHLIHAAEVIGYKHPNLNIADYWRMFYLRACKSMHMNYETEEQLDSRLNDFGQGFHNQQPAQPLPVKPLYCFCCGAKQGVYSENSIKCLRCNHREPINLNELEKCVKCKNNSMKDEKCVVCGHVVGAD